jgi:hypothetical protein
LFKISDVYTQGCFAGEMFTTTSPVYGKPDLLAVFKKDTLTIHKEYGRSFMDLDKKITFDRQLINQFPRIVTIWKKRRMAYAQWSSRGNCFQGCIGHQYAEPYESQAEFISNKQYKPEYLEIMVDKIVDGLHMVAVELVNGDTVEEHFQFDNGTTVEFSRTLLGFRHATQGLIFFEETLDEIFEFISLWRKRCDSYAATTSVNGHIDEYGMGEW